jgi:hypothetical protein
LNGSSATDVCDEASMASRKDTRARAAADLVFILIIILREQAPFLVLAKSRLDLEHDFGRAKNRQQQKRFEDRHV